MDADSVNNNAVEKKIAKLLAQLPTEDLLTLAETIDQVRHWMDNRFFRVLISQCWSARHEGRNDPLYPMLKSGEISRDVYNRVWLTVDFYQRLWELTQISFHHVRPALTQLGLSKEKASSAYELFAGAIRESANNTFSICLKPYHEVSTTKSVKHHKLLKKVSERDATPIEQKLLQSFRNQGKPQHILISLILAICKRKATSREKVLKAKLDDCFTALDRLADSEMTVCRNGGSFAWNKGELIGGKIGGSYAKDA